MDLTQDKPKPTRLIDKIRYFPKTSPQNVGEVLAKDGIRFASVSEMKQETIQMEIKKQPSLYV